MGLVKIFPDPVFLDLRFWRQIIEFIEFLLIMADNGVVVITVC